MTETRLEAAKERLRNHGWHLGDGEGLQDCPFARALLRVLEKVPVPNEPGVDPLLIGHGDGIREAQDEILAALDEIGVLHV